MIPLRDFVPEILAPVQQPTFCGIMQTNIEPREGTGLARTELAPAQKSPGVMLTLDV